MGQFVLNENQFRDESAQGEQRLNKRYVYKNIYKEFLQIDLVLCSSAALPYLSKKTGVM